MKIEIEHDLVTLKMTADEAGMVHGIICSAISRIKRNWTQEPAGQEEEEKAANMLASLVAFERRLQDSFYKHQHN